MSRLIGRPRGSSAPGPGPGFTVLGCLWDSEVKSKMCCEVSHEARLSGSWRACSRLPSFKGKPARRMASAGVIKEPGAWVTVAHQTAGGGSRSSSAWSVPARAAVGAPQSTGPQGRDPPHPATPASLLATTARQHHPKLLLNEHARCTLLGTLPRPAAGQHIPGREGPALPLTSPFSADSRTTCHGNTMFDYGSRLAGH